MNFDFLCVIITTLVILVSAVDDIDDLGNVIVNDCSPPKSKDDIDEIPVVAFEKSDHVRAGVKSKERSVENIYGKYGDEINSKIDNDLPDKETLLEQVEDLLILIESVTTFLNTTQKDTDDDLNNFGNKNRFVRNCVRMQIVIEGDEESYLRYNFTHKACVDFEKLYQNSLPKLMVILGDYIDTYEKFFQNKRDQIAKNITQLKQIEDDIKSCEEDNGSCLATASKEIDSFKNLEFDLASFLDETDKELLDLKMSAYTSMNVTAASITPVGVKAYDCVRKLTSTRYDIERNVVNQAALFPITKDHLDNQRRLLNDFINETHETLKTNLTAVMNSIMLRIKVHKDKANHSNIDEKTCGEEEIELNSIRNKSLGMFQDVANDLKEIAMKQFNETFVYIEKYRGENMYINLSQCIDEECIDNLLKTSNNASEDIHRVLLEMDEKIKQLQNDTKLNLKEKAIEESFSIGASKTYDEITECIDKLWMTKSKVTEDLTIVKNNFVKFTENLDQIEKRVEEYLDYHQQNEISSVRSQYKKNLTNVTLAESELKDFSYYICKSSVKAFKSSNYSESLDKIILNYRNPYESFMNELSNDSKHITTKLIEVQKNLANCQENDIQCLNYVFRQYESYLLRNLNSTIDDILEKNITLNQQFQESMKYIVGRVSEEGNQSVTCMKELADVIEELNNANLSLAFAKINLTDQIKSANMFIKDAKKKYNNDLDVLSIILMNRVNNTKAVAAEKKVNISSCVDANVILEDAKSRYIEDLNYEIGKLQTEMNKTEIKCRKNITDYDSTISYAFHTLSDCYQDSCLDLLHKWAQEVTSEQIEDIELLLSGKIKNYTSTVQLTMEISVNNFMRDAQDWTQQSLSCMEYSIKYSSGSSITPFSLLLIITFVMIEISSHLY